ncbi:hypothetical protein GGR53DRAFT_524277 [Hypoxylon sp. FL1150]|nr:hypothetical protein GGR53DRAFT_524277 [Hypoxylon sp. FL1150]
MFEMVSNIPTSSAGPPTPGTHTTIADSSTERFKLSSPQGVEQMETSPWPGDTYAIRDRKSGRYITLVNGKLRLVSCTGEQGGWFWQCEEKQGWLGFRSPVAGWYIGHDTLGSFVARVTHHQACEYFCARRHPEGGYYLLMRQDTTGDILCKMAIGDDGSTLVMSRGEGTLWDFEKVHEFQDTETSGELLSR